jgi:hypothetical protein
LYASDDTETPQLYTRAHTATVTDSNQNAALGLMYNQKSEYFKLYFQGGSEDGTVTMIEMVDGQKSNRQTKKLVTNLAGIKWPMQFPIIFNSLPTSEPITFNLKDGLKGHKLSYIVMWENVR